MSAFVGRADELVRLDEVTRAAGGGEIAAAVVVGDAGTHVGDPILASNLTRRIDFALFMVEVLTNDELIHEAPAIVGSRAPSALAGAAS